MTEKSERLKSRGFMWLPSLAIPVAGLLAIFALSAPASYRRNAAPARPALADPSAGGAAPQFAFFCGTNLFCGSNVVQWDAADSQVSYQPNTSGGPQQVMEFRPSTYAANCGSNSQPTQISNDVDSSYYVVGYCGGSTYPGVKRFQFTLDADGQVSMYGSTSGSLSGGIDATNCNTGNVAFPLINHDGTYPGPCTDGDVANVFDATSGLPTQFAGFALPTSPQTCGVGVILGSRNFTSSAAIPTTTIYAVPAGAPGGNPANTNCGNGANGAMYRMDVYAITTSASNGSAWVTLRASYADDNGSNNSTSALCVMTATGSNCSASFPFEDEGPNDIQFSTPGYSDTGTTKATIKYYVRVIAE